MFAYFIYSICGYIYGLFKILGIPDEKYTSQLVIHFLLIFWSKLLCRTVLGDYYKLQILFCCVFSKIATPFHTIKHRRISVLTGVI